MADDAGAFRTVAATMTRVGPRLRLSFAPTLTKRIRFDFGASDAETGMQIVEMGVLSRSMQGAVR